MSEQYLKAEFAKWKEFVDGNSASVSVPFLPIARFGSKPFSAFFSRLVRHYFGSRVGMLTLMTKNGAPQHALFEEIVNGRVQYWRAFKHLSEAKVRTALSKERKRISSTKYVDSSVISGIEKAANEYERTRSEAKYLLLLAGILAAALKSGALRFAPEPLPVKTLREMLQRIEIDFNNLAYFAPYLPSIELAGKSGSLHMGNSRMRVSMDSAALLSFLDRVAAAQNLSDAFFTLLTGLAKAETRGKLRTSPIPLHYVLPALGKQVGKIQARVEFIVSTFASPMRLMLCSGTEAFVLVFDDGKLSEIRKFKAEADLKKTWLKVSREYAFVHVAFKPVALPALYEAYPRNEFIRGFEEMGILRGIKRLLYPLLLG
jgi:hypothetical protein